MQTSLKQILNFTANINIVRRVSSFAIDSNAEQCVKSCQDIPGPSSLPVIGQLLHFLPGGSFHDLIGVEFQERLFKQYGPIVRIDSLFGAPVLVFIFDPEAAAQILRGENMMPVRPTLNSLDYYRRVYSRKNEESYNKPTGLITDQGEMWKKFRYTVNPILLKPKTVKLYNKILDEVGLDMVARLKSVRDEKCTIQSNFDVEMNLWALESIGVVALGNRLRCLDPDLPQDAPARRLIQVIHDIFTVTEKLDFKPSLWRYFTTPTLKRAMNLYEELKILSKDFIIKAMEQKQHIHLQSNDEKSILEKLMEIDEETAVIMANDMLFAGVDTTSNSMISILYHLATNPQKQIKLREEIMSQQERRPYLKACIKESMRIRPVARGNLRKITKHYNIMGYKIPKDVLIIIPHQNLSTMEDQYPQPYEYIPERWLAEKDDPLCHRNAHPFAFSPFGFGLRNCVGRRIVELNLETVVARMIENFHIEWFGPPLKTRSTFINHAAPPYNFIFKDVKSI